MNAAATPTWFITGASSGLGRALAQSVAARGWNAVLTARVPADLQDIAEGAPNVVRVPLDVTREGDAERAVASAHQRFGQIDFLVNSAGYGYLAPVEEGDLSQVRRMFEVNLFGALAVMRAALPLMREQRAGTIINISSLGGLMAGAGSGYYGATKFALEAVSEALFAELRPIGIHVMVANPSALRTDWLARSLTSPATVLPDYEPTVGTMLASLPAANGKQPGDPARAAEAIISAALSLNPPRNLLLGNRAVDVISEKLVRLSSDIDTWAPVSRDIDFPNEAAR